MNYTWQPRGSGLVDDLGRQFQRVLRGAHQGSYATRARYSEACERFIVFLAETFHLRKLANIEQKHLDAYVENLRKNGRADRYITTELSAIRWLHRQIPGVRRDLESGPGSNSRYELHEVRSGVERAWTEREFAAMVDKAQESGRQDIANALVAAWLMGLRLNEVVSLRRHQVEALLRNMTLAVTGKGGRPREIPGSTDIVDFFKGVIRDVPRGDYAFCPEGKTLTSFKAEIQSFLIETRGSVQDPDRKLTAHNLERGDRAALSFHGTRHSFAQRTVQRLMEDGLSQDEAYRLTAELLGHGRVEILSVYLSRRSPGPECPLEDAGKRRSGRPAGGEGRAADCVPKCSSGTGSAGESVQQRGLPLDEPEGFQHFPPEEVGR